MVGEVGLLSDGEELIETVRRPPPLLVGLAQPQLSIADDPLVEPVVVNVDVGRAASPDGHTNLVEQIGSEVCCIHGSGLPSPENPRSCIFPHVSVAPPPIFETTPMRHVERSRTPDRTRTCNRRGRNPMLYPVELQGRCRG